MMNRRQAGKLLSLAFTAPFAAPALTDALAVSNAAHKKAPYLLKKSTWTDKTYQTIVSNYLKVNMFNAGMPQTHAHIGFPHASGIDPTSEFDIPVDGIGLGSEYAQEILGDFDPIAFLDEMRSQMEPGLDEQFKGFYEEMKAMQAQWDSYTTTSLDPATVGAAAGVAGVIVAVVGLGLAAFAFGWQVAKDIRNAMDDDKDGVPNGKDKFPNDPDKNFMPLDDMDGNGVPDWLEGMPVYARDSLGSASFFPEKSEAFISFTAQDSALVIDAAVSHQGRSNATRITLKG